jgi:4-hydroxybenzoyl-CoA reductase beta subunit
MIINSNIKYRVPETIREFQEVLKDCKNMKILGGGTDLIPLLKYEVKNPEYLISIMDLEETKGLIDEGGCISIGASVTLDEITSNKTIIEYFPSLAYSAKCVASPQIRNTATIAGNILQDRRCIYYNQTTQWRSSFAPCFKTGGDICHQAPNSPVCKALYYSDLAPVLMTLEAQVLVIEDGIEKTMPVGELIASHTIRNGTLEESDLLILKFIISKDKTMINTFHKYSIRQSIDFPVLNIALNYRVSEENSLDKKLNIVVGATSSSPFHLAETEKAMIDHISTGKPSLEEVHEKAVEEITKKSKLVRETGLSIKAKRKYLKNIIPVLNDILKKIS